MGKLDNSLLFGYGAGVFGYDYNGSIGVVEKMTH
jgi:hypothetical protein